MATPAKGSTLISEMGSVNLYKRSQGQLARLATALAIAGACILGAYSLSQTWLSTYGPNIQIGVPAALAALGCWFAFRLVNFPRFAEFLISVQAEMDKVSWSSRSELYRATVVVLGMMFLLGFLLFLYDYIWYELLSAVGILQF